MNYGPEPGRHRAQPKPSAPLGRAPGEVEPEDEPDVAGEHQETAVDTPIITGTDSEREPESPRGWSGMQR